MKAFAVLVFTLLISFPSSSFSKEIKEDFHKSFDVEKGFKLKLESGDGDVTIIPWDKDVLDVKVRYRAEQKSYGARKKNDFEVDFEQRGETIYINGREKSHTYIGVHIKKRYEYTYEIQSPNYLTLEIDGEDGHITIQGWKGEIECMTDDGDIHLSDISNSWTELRTEDGDIELMKIDVEDLYLRADDGDISLTEGNIRKGRISVEDGKITIKQCKGNLEMKSDDGNILAQKLTSRFLEVETTDGYVEIELAKSEEVDVDISTDDGDVVLDIEDGTSAAISIDTDDGRIKMNLPNIERYEEDEHWASGELHGGNGQIHIRTADGDILLREAQ